jgi:PAS domain S-box-containing protein
VLKWSVERKTIAGFVLAGLAALLVVASMYLTAQNFVASSRRVWQSMDVSSKRERVYSALVDTVLAQRSYAVTRDPRYLEERHRAIRKLRTQSTNLSRASEGSSAEFRDMVVQLQASLQNIARLFDQLLELQGTPGGPDGPAGLPLQLEARADLLKVRALLDRMEGLEQQVLSQRLAEDRRSARLLWVWLGCIGVTLLVTLAWLLRRILADLQERRAVENRLHEANRFLESLLESIPAMVFAKDARTLRFVRFNRAGEELLGYPRAALLGKCDADFFPPQQAEFFTNRDREVLRNQQLLDIREEEIDTRVLGRRILHTRKVPVLDAQGEPALLLGISIDITSEKEYERRILALNEQLQRHSQLLESSNRELESFCYSVSHDLRAPLRAINGFARLLQLDSAQQLGEQGVRYLNTICSASEQMGRLIDDLLEFSRLGRQNLESDSVDMTSLAKDALRDILGSRTGAPPAVAIEALPDIRGDRRMLRLTWLNLLDNAVKYAGGGAQPQITVQAHAQSNEVVYQVRDNGIGFDMRYYDKLFGVFQRLHSSADYPGTGVGLAIAERVVARHGGRIWAESTLGQGATFFFALPAEAPPTVPLGPVSA